MIGRAGVGLENVDVAAAAAGGIQVVYTPAASTDAVAEHTVGLMLALERRLVAGDASVRAGRLAEARRAPPSRELHQCTLGIVGMGRIGRAVGRIAVSGLGMELCYNDIVDVSPLPFPATPVDKSELYRRSDVVSLHVPLTDETHGLIDDDALRHFKPSATLINTARGAVISADAVARALGESRLAGVAVDVYDPEPPDPDHPLLSAPNVLFSAHTAARTTLAQARMNEVVDDVLAVLAGRRPQFPASA